MGVVSSSIAFASPPAPPPQFEPNNSDIRLRFNVGGSALSIPEKYFVFKDAYKKNIAASSDNFHLIFSVGFPEIVSVHDYLAPLTKRYEGYIIDVQPSSVKVHRPFTELEKRFHQKQNLRRKSRHEVTRERNLATANCENPNDLSLLMAYDPLPELPGHLVAELNDYMLHITILDKQKLEAHCENLLSNKGARAGEYQVCHDYKSVIDEKYSNFQIMRDLSKDPPPAPPRKHFSTTVLSEEVIQITDTVYILYSIPQAEPQKAKIKTKIKQLVFDFIDSES